MRESIKSSEVSYCIWLLAFLSIGVWWYTSQKASVQDDYEKEMWIEESGINKLHQTFMDTHI